MTESGFISDRVEAGKHKCGRFRPTVAILLAPVALWVLWHQRWTPRLAALAMFTASVAIWLVPLVVLSGGPAAYLAASGDLVRRVSSTTPIGYLWQVAANVQQVVLVLLLATQAAGAFLVLALRRSGPAFRLPADVRGLLLWWMVQLLLR